MGSNIIDIIGILLEFWINKSNTGKTKGKNMYNIILASGSPRRKEIFDQVGVKFQVCSSDKEEIINKKIPEEIVIELSAMKATDIQQQVKGAAIIIGADTMVAMNHQVMGKPKDVQDAKAMLNQLQGNKHQVYTGVTVIIMKSDDCKEIKTISFVEVTDVWVNSMTAEQIDAYTSTNEPYDKAGAYGIQGSFAINISKIEGDYYNIMGFPISKLYTVLLKEGIDILNP